MGTRGLLGFIIKGVRKGTYNHYDSYPIGLGLNIMKWIQSLSDAEIAKMVEQVEGLEWVDSNSTPSQELQDRYSAAGFSRTHMDTVWDDVPATPINTGKIDNWYNLLHRLQGGKALPYILDGSLKHLSDDTDFAVDGLFCEWAYWIDFSDRTFETVQGSPDRMGVHEKVKFEELGPEYVQQLEKSGKEEEDIDEEDE